MKLEAKAFVMVVVVAAFMFLGSYFTMVVPLTDEKLNTALPTTTPYTALEERGKARYVSEGCWYCHTAQVRNLLEETQRYGMGQEETYKRFGIRTLIQAPPTQPGEIVYDRPHILGTRRVGPDLGRVGGKYDNSWHVNHLRDPRSTSPGSLMPAYTWLFDKAGQPTDECLALVAFLQKLGTNIKWREDGIAQFKKLHPELVAPPAADTTAVAAAPAAAK
jgi:cytochrome c oxidase cbb3-type subunit I/II